MQFSNSAQRLAVTQDYSFIDRIPKDWYWMSSGNMFSKFKSSSAPNALESNPIWHQFEVGKQSATAGPEHVWRILDAYRKCDGKEVSIFLFEKRSVEKLHKPKRKETVTEILRVGVRQLERYRHPKILQVMHTVEECAETLAFASEPVLASLANVLAFEEQKANAMAQSSTAQQQNAQTPSHRPVFSKEYEMLDIELKYGLLQITEALSFLHYSGHVLHRNVCPSSIIITKKGTWKLSGLDFIERVSEIDGLEPVPCQSWTNKLSKMAQPNLDYIAPEVQQDQVCNILSDMFSLGMVICAIFNQGRPLIQANHSCSSYLKQLETLDDQVHNILPRVPVPLQEAVVRLLHKDPRQRPTAQLLSLIKYFSDPSVHALQFLDVINMKDSTQKAHFYRNTLKEVLPYIPRKLWYQHIWPYLQAESKSQEAFVAVLQPMLYIIQDSTVEEYEKVILPSFKAVLSTPKSIQATVILLENLHLILEKTPRDDIRSEVLPVLYSAFESSTIQVQTAALVAVSNVTEYLDDMAIRRIVLPKLKFAFERNSTDVRILMNVLSCILDRLDKQQIIDEVLPLLWDVKLQEPEIVMRVLNIYRIMLNDKKYGLSVNLMATRVMPSLLPQTVNPALNLDQFTLLLEVLQEMLNHIERNQRNKLKLDNLSLPSPERHRSLRHQYSTDNMHAPPFNIPNLRIEQRKTSSAEDMARKNSIGSMSMTASAENMARKNSMAGMLGSWWFGSSSSTNDGNFLRVGSTFTSRRLSDNTLMTPKIRIAPSCASSPGGTPGGGLPIRRHSSTGPQERRGSNINLSPPTGGGMPITSSSVPYLLSSSMNSIRGSRRPSVSSTSSQQGTGLLQQFGSGMYQLFSGRS
ncbi:SCY1-like protein 2 isoform X2 [Cephus cinctus]|uniref:SCY1-like protein 2 isoform X2 n=1 Tax=Cephus cinctus TaxID=211228 RepID=A0AAJ7R9Y3_CEPCN|nr:SCY1-like protein 2 isoform X2 [Cephus cinctus]